VRVLLVGNHWTERPGGAEKGLDVPVRAVGALAARERALDAVVAGAGPDEAVRPRVAPGLPCVATDVGDVRAAVGVDAVAVLDRVAAAGVR
jgi:hypothetical protein